MKSDLRYLYFAYGSNLDRTQMRERCADARFVCRAMVSGYRLAFAGASKRWEGAAVATLVPSRKGCVSGVLYSLSEQAFERLDRFEGHPEVYVRARVRVADEHGRRRYAQTYALPLLPEAQPAMPYLERIARAYLRLGFGLAPLLDAAIRGAA
ncbi:MAG: gamma-glutamylcyclotransferase family protein [Polyangiales bacterium]